MSNSAIIIIIFVTVAKQKVNVDLKKCKIAKSWTLIIMNIFGCVSV